MRSILFWCGEDMEAAGEPQRINRKVNFAPLPGNLPLNFAPVVLELVSWLGPKRTVLFDGRILRLGWMQ